MPVCFIRLYNLFIKFNNLHNLILFYNYFIPLFTDKCTYREIELFLSYRTSAIQVITPNAILQFRTADRLTQCSDNIGHG